MVVTLHKLFYSHLKKLKDNNSNMNIDDNKRPSDNKESSNEFKRLKESNSEVALQEDVTVTIPSPISITLPISIMSKSSCKATALTISDQHATLLLTHTDHDNKEGNKEASSVKNSTTSADGNETIVDDTTVAVQKQVKVVQSLLRITLIPFYKLILGSTPIYYCSNSDEKLLKQNKTGGDLKPLDHHNPVASSNFLNFPKEYQYKLKRESGAEYK